MWKSPFLAGALGTFSIITVAQAPTPAQAHPPLPPPPSGWTFPTKQTLTYTADWRVFSAGTATVHLETDGPVERVSVTGDSQGAINLLFRVSDRFQASFSRASGCSQSFSKQLMEGRRQVDSDQQIDGARRVANYDERNLISRIHTHRLTPVPPCVTDLLSGVFIAAAQTLEPGSTVRLPVLSGDHVSDVAVHVEARETVRTPSATYSTVRVQPTVEAPAGKPRGKLWIWYTDDSRHIPVQMRARLFWGTLNFRLTAIDNK